MSSDGAPSKSAGAQGSGRSAVDGESWQAVTTPAADAEQRSRHRQLRRQPLGVLILIACLSGCATAGGPSPSSQEVADPIEPVNRAIFSFNMFLDRILLEPVARAYRFVTPEAARRSVANFLANLRSPVIFANDALQGQRERAGITLGRFMINTTLGVAGLFDPATAFGYPRHDEDFGQTLAVHGVEEGPYMVLPFFGPSNPRDAVGLATDLAVDPTNFIPMKQHIWWAAGRAYFTILDLRSQNYQTLQDIQRTSIDYYSSLRSFYRQYRDQQISNGRKPDAPAELPDF